MDLSQMSDEEDAGYQERRKREEWCKGLRQLANVIEGNPQLGLPFGSNTFDRLLVPMGTKSVLADWVRAIPGKVDKQFDDYGWLNVHIKLGEFHMNAYIARDQVCERIVTGTKEVRKLVPHPDAEMVEKVEIVDEYEWKCSEPLLA